MKINRSKTDFPPEVKSALKFCSAIDRIDRYEIEKSAVLASIIVLLELELEIKISEKQQEKLAQVFVSVWDDFYAAYTTNNTVGTKMAALVPLYMMFLRRLQK